MIEGTGVVGCWRDFLYSEGETEGAARSEQTALWQRRTVMIYILGTTRNVSGVSGRVEFSDFGGRIGPPASSESTHQARMPFRDNRMFIC